MVYRNNLKFIILDKLVAIFGLIILFDEYLILKKMQPALFALLAFYAFYMHYTGQKFIEKWNARKFTLKDYSQFLIHGTNNEKEFFALSSAEYFNNFMESTALHKQLTTDYAESVNNNLKDPILIILQKQNAIKFISNEKQSVLIYNHDFLKNPQQFQDELNSLVILYGKETTKYIIDLSIEDFMKKFSIWEEYNDVVNWIILFLQNDNKFTDVKRYFQSKMTITLQSLVKVSKVS
jgi:hypothetical protein